MTIDEILAFDPSLAITHLRDKSICVPDWGLLEREYDTKWHPVNCRSTYPDVICDDGAIQKVTRVALPYQRLLTSRMTGLMFGIQQKRIYKVEKDNARKQEAANYLENIFQRNRIDSVNVERSNMLFAGCEVATLWWAIKETHNNYGIDSSLKFRCANYSPMKGDMLYPLFDEYGDMVAMSFDYKRKVLGETIEYFDTYTANRHIKYEIGGGKTQYQVVEDEQILMGKIPAIYMYRPTPIWENTSAICYEIEMAKSRNGNYLRANTKPVVAVMASEGISFGKEKSGEAKGVMHLPSEGDMKYVTWDLPVDSLTYHVDGLENDIYTMTQIPNISFHKMSDLRLSGEAFRQIFVDAQLKVKEESGRFNEFLSREVSVVKSFAKIDNPSLASEIESLQVEIEIIPFTVNEDKTLIENLATAVAAGIMAKSTAISLLGWVDNSSDELEKIIEEQKADVMEPTV